MKYSLVISTVGRADDLRRMLQSLDSQTERDFEVLVVDQSGGDAIAQVVGEFAPRLAIRRLPMSQRGLSRGRNYGWAHARGEILNFPDDDCTWPPDLLARVNAILDARSDLTALTTRVETVSRCDVDGGPVNRRNLFGRAVEFTMFLRRDAVGDLRYDEQMGVGAGTPWGADEGPDLMLRMLARGLAIEYFPEICIYHPDPALQPAERLLSRTLSYSRGRGYLYRKHGYSWLTVGYSLVRSLGGSILMLLTGRVTKARVYWRAFWGKLIGYVTAGKPPAQTVSSPLVAETRPA